MFLFTQAFSSNSVGHIGPKALAGGPVEKLLYGDIVLIAIDRKNLSCTMDFIGEGKLRFPPPDR